MNNLVKFKPLTALIFEKNKYNAKNVFLQATTRQTKRKKKLYCTIKNLIKAYEVS